MFFHECIGISVLTYLYIHTYTYTIRYIIYIYIHIYICVSMSSFDWLQLSGLRANTPDQIPVRVLVILVFSLLATVQPRHF